MRLPEWIRVKSVVGSHRTKSLLRSKGLSTVCEEARCPNRGECFSRPTATFLILGDVCTRNCNFCSVSHGRPEGVDADEPVRVAEAARELGLRYVVITSVTRDDLPDGGAGQFAKTVKEIKARLPDVKVEVLIPDFKGDRDAIRMVLDAEPDVLNHNLETVPSLYETVRPQADYRRSLKVLKLSKEINRSIPTKSGLMVGLGETKTEVISVMRDLRNVGCDFLTIGQYLRPSMGNLEVVEYVHPDTFEYYRQRAVEMGFRFVASAPLVRSSMNAEEMYYKGR
ncbi:MAG: lipoyl synthase [Nitrospirae bacterium]|nr:MAG: lipoyl synthase [Nitrospirota bacterium]